MFKSRNDVFRLPFVLCLVRFASGTLNLRPSISKSGAFQDHLLLLAADLRSVRFGWMLAPSSIVTFHLLF
jgi:hypothetical protein